MSYRRVGRSGLKLPSISLGMWHNFGPDDSIQNQREMLRTAFDLGINHFDLADNYGGGMAEMNVGRFLKEDFKSHRDELIISSKSGHLMWDGPLGGGSGGGSRKHLLAGIDQSLKRLDLDYVDIFYHHVPDPDTPLEETADALAQIVRQGKALYVGISKYYGELSRQMIEMLKEAGAPCLINQLPFSLLNQKAKSSGEFEGLVDDGVGAITFSPLAQGLLTDRYLNGIPSDSRVGKDSPFLKKDAITQELVNKVRKLTEVAAGRGQSLAQMAVSWNLCFQPVASVLIGASKPEQIKTNVEALDAPAFSESELSDIDRILMSS